MFFKHVARPMKIMAGLLMQHRPPTDIMKVMAVEDEEKMKNGCNNHLGLRAAMIGALRQRSKI